MCRTPIRFCAGNSVPTKKIGVKVEPQKVDATLLTTAKEAISIERYTLFETADVFSR